MQTSTLNKKYVTQSRYKFLLILCMLSLLLTASLSSISAYAQDYVPGGGPKGVQEESLGLGSGEYEIGYDDGTWEEHWAWTVPCGYWAVRFTATFPPGVPFDLVEARFYLYGFEYPMCPFEVVVFHADGVTEYRRLTVPGPEAEGWYELEFDPPINIHEFDFYIAIHYIEEWPVNTPYLCQDRDGTPDGRSYHGHPEYGPWPMDLWIDPFTGEQEDWMIRAVVTEKEVVTPVGGEIAPVNTFGLLAPWIAITILAFAIGSEILSRRKPLLN